MLLPRPEESELAIGPPGAGPGYWAGASSAVVGDDGIYLAYRLRRPVGRGRGYGTSVARSEDGVHFEPLQPTYGASGSSQPRISKSRSTSIEMGHAHWLTRRHSRI